MNKTLPLALSCILTLSACGPEDDPGGRTIDVPEPWSTCSADDGMGGLDLGGNFMDDVPENLSVDGDVLSVIVSYGGGCERHDFEMCWPEPSFMESEPVQVNLEIWHGERVAVLGSNGSGKSHFLRLLALGGSDPDVEHQPVGEMLPEPVAHTGRARLGSRVRPGWFAQTHDHSRLRGRTLLEILHRGDAHRSGMPQEQAARALDRYELAKSGEQTYDTLSGGQQARMQILLLELSGATLLLLDEPMAGLGHEEGLEMTQHLARLKGKTTIILVEHDMDAVFGLADRVTVLVGGTVLATGTPAEIRANPDVRNAYLGDDQ